MKKLPVAIPLHGKMIYRSLHSTHLMQVFSKKNLFPVFYVERNILPRENEHYDELQLAAYTRALDNTLVSISRQLRWFMVHTQSTESRFRNMISDTIWQSEKINLTLLKTLFINVVRSWGVLGPGLASFEELLVRTNEHIESWRRRGIDRVLVSGMGNWDFEIGCLFAREAQRNQLSVVASITNYDNLLSKGFRGFLPDVLAVWSQKMKKQAVDLLKVPANRVAITGPTAFDRYFTPLSESRENFLAKRGLDPHKKTVFYAGHTSIVTYFDFLELVFKLQKPGGILADCNLIIRPYPHQKVADWSGMKIFRSLISQIPHVYISDPFEHSNDLFEQMTGEAVDTSSDELHGILRYSDLMINYFSTLGLEAAICDLPTIHIGYDKFTYQISPMAWSVTGAHNAHNQDAQRRAASQVVTSDKHLTQAIEAYLNNRNLHQAERLEYALSECEFLDGHATERLAEVIATTSPRLKRKQR
jgi:hypothetical protein